MAPILILVFVSAWGLVATLFSMSLGAPWMLFVAIPATIGCFVFQVRLFLCKLTNTSQNQNQKPKRKKKLKKAEVVLLKIYEIIPKM